MEKRKWIPATVAVVILVIGVVALLLYIFTMGMTTYRITIRVGFHDPEKIDANAWSLEVSNITGYHEPEHENVDQFGVLLRKEDSIVIPISDLRNGFVGKSNDTFVFFEDNGIIGRLDAGDVFYLVGVESASDYEFHLVFMLNYGSVGRVSMTT